MYSLFVFFFFFFQAEDGIRDGRVTGVQTCALPIYGEASRDLAHRRQERQRAVLQLDGLVADRRHTAAQQGAREVFVGREMQIGDRKSTRLNSSHPSISYAVFCLKKKKKNKL